MCHPYAGAMLIFSVFFQFRHLTHPKVATEIPKRFSIYTFDRVRWTFATPMAGTFWLVLNIRLPIESSSPARMGLELALLTGESPKVLHALILSLYWYQSFRVLYFGEAWEVTRTRSEIFSLDHDTKEMSMLQLFEKLEAIYPTLKKQKILTSGQMVIAINLDCVEIESAKIRAGDEVVIF